MQAEVGGEDMFLEGGEGGFGEGAVGKAGHDEGLEGVVRRG